VERLILYEVTESELEMLSRGIASDSVYLNFAVALLSVAISFVIALTSTTIESIRTFTVFVVLASVGGISGLLLLLLWFKGNQSVVSLIAAIKNRLPERPATQQQGSPTPNA